MKPAEDDPEHVPPGAWEPAQRIARKLTRPLERFLQVEASSGLVLLGAALVALVWANSPLGPLYERLWETHVTFGVGDLRSSETIHFWVNDGLMVVFFFVVGLEIRREIHAGELSELRRAALPVAAALGGMAAPALLYVAVNHSGPGREGWGVPMATDIAFAVGVLALLGKRVPAALRVFLLALAIIDDLGAIVVIALFYSGSLAWAGAVVALGGLFGVLALQKLGVRQPLAYVVPGVVLWWGTLRLGVHPTIAGVALGLLTPVEPWYGHEGFVRASTSAIHEIRARAKDGSDGRALAAPLARIARARREAIAPVVRLEHALHGWVAFGIMPLFALANAGVRVGDVHLAAPGTLGILGGVVLGLVVGKPLGIVLASLFAVKAGFASLPRGVGPRGLLLVGIVAGIGFTMAIFIAGLAFSDPGRLGVAKLGVLLASAIAGVLSVTVGRLLLARSPSADLAAVGPDEAEVSTEL